MNEFYYCERELITLTSLPSTGIYRLVDAAGVYGSLVEGVVELSS